MTQMIAYGKADELVEKLRRNAARKSNLDRDKELLEQAAGEIERIANWCRKLIDGIDFTPEKHAIIEECAVVLETFPKDFWGYTQEEVIAAIRALKDKP